MKRLVLLSAALALCLVAAPSPASAGYWKPCGGASQAGPDWFGLEAHNLNCETARKVARRFANTHVDQQLGFTCQVSTEGNDPDRVGCRRELGGRAQTLHFRVPGNS